jgi:hypothetical protein
LGKADTFFEGEKRAPRRPRQQISNPALQDAVGGQTDRILDPLDRPALTIAIVLALIGAAAFVSVIFRLS